MADIGFSAGRFGARLAEEAAKALDHVASEVFERGSRQQGVLRGLAGQLRRQQDARSVRLSGSPEDLAEAVKAAEHVASGVFEREDPERDILRAFAQGIRDSMRVPAQPKEPQPLSAAQRALVLGAASELLAVARDQQALDRRFDGIHRAVKAAGDPRVGAAAAALLPKDGTMRAVLGLSMSDWWPGMRAEIAEARRAQPDLCRVEDAVGLPPALAAMLADYRAAVAPIQQRAADLAEAKEAALAVVRAIGDEAVLAGLVRELPPVQPGLSTPVHDACKAHASRLRAAAAEATVHPAFRR